MEEKNKNIKHYSAACIQDYIDGKLSSSDRHALEKAALDDPFLADAIEGLSGRDSRTGSKPLKEDLEELQFRLSERVSTRQKARLMPDIRFWLQLAASMTILIGLSVFTYTFFIRGGVPKNISDGRNPKIVADSPASRGKVKNQPYPRKDSADRAAASENQQALKPPHVQRENGSLAKSRTHASMKLSSVKTSNNHGDSAKGVAAIEKVDDITEQKSNPQPRNGDTIDFSIVHQSTFIGKVIDMNNHPVIGATVSLPNENRAVITDNNGIFTLRSARPDSTAKVTVQSDGFQSRQATLINENDITGNIINLKSTRAVLNEVVMSRYLLRKKAEPQDIASDQTRRNAEPVTGWKKYKEYLDKNKRLSSDSIGLRVIEVVSFSIKSNGKLSNFAVEKSYNDDFDAEAIRLIKHGPAWKLLKGRKPKQPLP